MIRTRLFLSPVLFALSFLVAPSCAAAPRATGWSYPVVAGYGGVHVWRGAVGRPDPKAVYKVVAVVNKGSARARRADFQLMLVARMFNDFAAAGVPLSHLHVLVIVAGPATPLVLGETSFLARYHHSNPNLVLLRRLERVGARIEVCGNALYGFGLNPDELAPHVRVAYSAITSVIEAEKRGYAFF